MISTARAANQQESESAIFGSGAIEAYSWWETCEPDGWDYGTNRGAPDGWSWIVRMYTDVQARYCDVEEPGRISQHRVTHEDIMSAARKIRRKDFPAADAVKRGSRDLLSDADGCIASIDAGVADTILQVAVLGRVQY
ncbi:hypothetical protein [Streptomyces sp. YIM 121038]|uniref:hypothetical protein n=1 Tax=Streptomyces sp. YIM 121038 TaxID=2136401 RepID=UPI0011104C0C|nr:hypothetical protein [Streptomyces sp. YIM 121038]